MTNQQTVALQHTTCRDGHTTFTKSEEQKWKSRLTKEGNSPLGVLDDDSVFLLEVDGHTLAGQLRGKGHGEKKKNC